MSVLAVLALATPGLAILALMALALRTPAALAALAAVPLAKSSVDAAAERAAGVRRPLQLYPALTLLKDVLVGAVWIVPFASTTVTWRGNRFRIGPRSLLSPESVAPASLALGPASAGAAG